MTIITPQYLDKIYTVVNATSCDLEAIEIVPNIKKWCDKNNIEENNIDRAGKCLVNEGTGKHLILLAQRIEPETVTSIIDTMDVRGLHQETGYLNSSWKFLKHLVLHEISHAKNPNFTELQCDIWAFDKMREIEA